MTHRVLTGAAAFTAAMGVLVSTPAEAQWVPGAEITGQTIEAETNGVINRIEFLPGGVAKISSPNGTTVVDATWTATGGELCLTTATTSDCYPYVAAFQAGQPVSLMSKCNMLTRWSASMVNPPPPEPRPERGQ